ncbi:hypothetical protein UlMin_025153 [Ulmus minor]
MSNPIVAILANEQLIGENFVKWKSNMNIVLLCENYKFVLTEECPPELATNVTRNRHEAVKAVMNTKMKNVTYVREHVIKMVNYINEAKVNGATIDEATQLQIFKSISKKKYTEAKVAERNVTEAQASSSKNKNKRKKHTGGKEKPIGKGKQIDEGKSKKNKNSKDKKPKGKCFHCGIDGH